MHERVLAGSPCLDCQDRTRHNTGVFQMQRVNTLLGWKVYWKHNGAVRSYFSSVEVIVGLYRDYEKCQSGQARMAIGLA